MDAVCRDLETAPVSEAERVLLGYVLKVNDAPAACTQLDVDAVKAAGWSEDAIYDAVTVCGIFNFFNRWIDGTGVPDVPARFYEQRLSQAGDVGYAM